MKGQSVLGRYLFREAWQSWAAVTVVLLAIMLATRLARFLGEAAKGNIDPSLLLTLVGLSSVRYLTILIPVSLLIGVMLTLGRLYRDSEIDAMHAGGLGLGGLYRPFLRLGFLLALLGGMLSLWLSPFAARTADFLVKEAASRMAFAVFEPGQFRSLPDGRGTLYMESYDPESGALSEVFAEVRSPEMNSIVMARSGRFRIDDNGRHALLLEDGSRLDVLSDGSETRLTRFGQHGLAVTPPEFVYSMSRSAFRPTMELWFSDSLQDAAELHWRLATPISTWLLVLLAVPLAKTSARKGRYGRLGWGVLGFVLYFNLLGMGQAWLESGRLPLWLGLWWVHLIVAAIGCALWLRAGRYGARIRQGML